jgi:hypothetical protein
VPDRRTILLILTRVGGGAIVVHVFAESLRIAREEISPSRLLRVMGEAMPAEEKGGYAAATTAWKQAAKLRPADTMPADRARALDARMAMAQIGQE